MMMLAPSMVYFQYLIPTARDVHKRIEEVESGLEYAAAEWKLSAIGCRRK